MMPPKPSQNLIPDPTQTQSQAQAQVAPSSTPQHPTNLKEFYCYFNLTKPNPSQHPPTPHTQLTLGNIIAILT